METVAAQNGTELAVLGFCWTGHRLLSRSPLTLQRIPGKRTEASHLLCNLMQKYTSARCKMSPGAQCPRKQIPTGAPTVGWATAVWDREGRIRASESSVKTLPKMKGINGKQKLQE